MGDYTEHEHTNDTVNEVDAAMVNDGFAGDYADSLDEYEGPTAEEAAQVFEQARREGFVLPDLSSLDLRKFDWTAIRRGDFSSFGQLELPRLDLPKVDLSKVDIRNLDVADLDPRRIDFDKVKHDASEFAATAVAKAGEVATDVRRNVESGVKLAREVVGL